MNGKSVEQKKNESCVELKLLQIKNKSKLRRKLRIKCVSRFSSNFQSTLIFKCIVNLNKMIMVNLLYNIEFCL
ncbi:hypothetical protein BpHYR1_050386 [Brachionus plicatilis]|uniref:Uncharacterized protein n=1 Tax=Brachionus plicatilis TaxID=10195 RepID=A0A3M7RFC0_BRAPC|nr:hypothetical protein BpHYR1_050386 [Brachionus plicatilis]